VPFRWPDNRLIDLFEIEHPIILAPMAGAMDAELAAEVSAGRRARFAAVQC
jgi:nitronate monooxygenase